MTIERHGSHPPGVICRPAGNGLCEPLPPGWDLVTDCETAGPLSEAVTAAGRKDDLPVRAHPWLPVGTILAMNRSGDEGPSFGSSI